MRSPFVVLVDTGAVYEEETAVHFKKSLKEATEVAEAFPENRAGVYVRLDEIRNLLTGRDFSLLNEWEERKK